MSFKTICIKRPKYYTYIESITVKLVRLSIYFFLKVLHLTKMWYIIIIIIMSHRQRGSPGPSSGPFSIVHCFRQVFRATSRIGTELLYVGSSWSSCLCSSMWKGPKEYVTYEFVFISPAVSRMSGSSNLDSFRDGWTAAVFWHAASRTCLILLAIYLSNCCQAFSPYV